MFKILKKSKTSRGRLGEIATNHGDFKTPIFMPPGTQAAVKAIGPDDLGKIGIEILLVNTLHLTLQPGENLIFELGGIHSFMGWPKPILSDSGGFQAWSLSRNRTKNGRKMVQIREDGIEFSSPINGSKHFLTPEKSIEIQHKLGADIIMAFDECSPDNEDKEYAKKAMQRTHKWALRSLKKHRELSKFYLEKGKNPPLIFGIVQGGIFEDLRKDSAKYIASLDFDGIALGGETIGYNMPRTLEILDYLKDLLPEDKARYTMGLGSSQKDIIEVVKRGVDMFDCVGPTRMARHGSLFTEDSNIHISNSAFEKDNKPIDRNCDCYTCQNFSRAYLHHLYSAKEPLYLRLATIHNLRFIMNLIYYLRDNF
ncbi:MAG: tRNA guanosine(34) transglycosylase Tgt [Candidatus Pacebacteria bacterium]|nr:tRNA guanosine(34) transglycosylase Tgt [Candidatus Paceibacterota bacterium]